MNPKHYCSLEMARKLYKAGIVLETEMVWAYIPDVYVIAEHGETVGKWALIKHPLYPFKEQYPAPTMAEAWRELPDGFVEKIRGTYCASLNKLDCPILSNPNPGDALAELLIWLKGEKP